MEQKLQPYLDNIASFFKKSKHHSIGVDIGSNSLKIVELEKANGKIKLKNYALVEMKEKLTRQEIRKFSGQMVKDILNQISNESKEVSIAIPSYSSLITLVEVSGRNDEEINKEIESDINKYIPIDVRDVVYDWLPINSDLNLELNKKNPQENLNNRDQENQNREGMVQKKVLLVSTRKDVSNEYEKSFEKNDLKISSIEVDCFSIQRSLIKGQLGNYLIVDIGKKVTNFIGIYKGQLLFNRNVDLAGEKLTNLISKSFNINEKRAELMKKKQGLKTDSKETLKNVLEPFCDSIIEQAKKKLKEFDEFKNLKLDKIILTGGGSEMIGLKDYIEKKMEIDVVYGNPWAGIDYPKEMEDKVLSLSPFFGVAVGLALIDLEYILKNK